MNNLLEKQLAGEIPVNGSNERMLELVECALSLGQQLCFVRWDSRIYDSMEKCLDDLDQATEARHGQQIREQIHAIRSLMSGSAPGTETRDFAHCSALSKRLGDIRALIDELEKADNNGQVAGGNGELMQENKQNIALLGEELALDEYMRWLQHAGFEVIHTRLPEDLPGLIDRHEPVALVVDLASYDDQHGVLDSIAPIMRNSACIGRLVFLSRRADQEIRLRAIQAGGDAFLTKPVASQLLMQHLELGTLAHRHDYSVMLIGDSNSLPSKVAPWLEKAGMTVKCLNNASQALLSVINFSPDLLVIEQSLSVCSGEELGRVIHQLADYEDLPVIYAGAGRQQSNDYRPDYPSEWVNTDSLGEEALVLMIDRMVCASRLRMNRIRQLQTSDPVTGLLNRQGFFQLIDRGLSGDGYTAIVLIEIDNLQQRYPQLSLQQTNRFLAKISRHLERLILAPTCSAHIGDYTFASMITGKTQDEVRKLGLLISHSLSSNIFDIEEHSLMVVCSIGIAIANGMQSGGMSLFTLATRACAEARHAGNNRVSVRSMEMTSATRVDKTENKELLDLLQDAIRSDGFRLVYQPVASLRGSISEKYEVLLRLDYGNGGAIPPRLFIPVAEDNGLILSIDRWVVGRAIQVMQKHGHNSHFFVNVSSGTLRDPGFPSFLKDCLIRFGADGERLVFDISASSVSQGIRQVAEFTVQVGMLGCGVSIEHGNFRQDVAPVLEHIKASYIKLNGEELRGIADDLPAQTLLKYNIDQAEQKGTMTIAGFVEDASSLQLLWQLGIHYIQGNFLQAPNESLDFEFGVEGTVQENFPA
ncbi:MAG: EAL domain-containing protein [Gammaproteobacteria bacterium]